MTHRQPRQSFRTIAHVELNAFLASVEEVLHPELERHAVVVGDDHGQVISSNRTARSFGIRPMMPIRLARQLSPNLEERPANLPTYERFSQKFFTILARFTDRIEPVALDEAYLDLSVLPYPFFTAEEVARAIHKAAHAELNLNVSVSVGPNKVVAKVAGELGKPDGIAVVRRGEERSFLGQLPVGLLPGVGSRTEEFLKAFGVRTIGQLSQLPQTLLHEHFGPSGLSLWALSCGVDRRPVEVPNLKQSVSRCRVFRDSTPDLSTVSSVSHELVGRIGRKLERTGQRGQKVIVQIRDLSGRYHQRQRTLPRGARWPEEFVSIVEVLLRELLGRFWPITHLAITVSDLRQTSQLPLVLQSFSKLPAIREALHRLKQRVGSRGFPSVLPRAEAYASLQPALPR